MSRIHEALKKAEQDRAAMQGSTAQSPVSSAAVLEVPPLPEAAVATMPPPITAGSMPAFSGVYSLDELLARCPQQEWKPDLSTMLLLNGNDDKQGTEQLFDGVLVANNNFVNFALDSTEDSGEIANAQLFCSRQLALIMGAHPVSVLLLAPIVWRKLRFEHV